MDQREIGVEDLCEGVQPSEACLIAQNLVRVRCLFLEMFSVAQVVRISEKVHQSEEVQHFLNFFSNEYSHLHCLSPTTLLCLQIHIPLMDSPANSQYPFGSFDFLENQLNYVAFSSFGASKVRSYINLEIA